MQGCKHTPRAGAGRRSHAGKKAKMANTPVGMCGIALCVGKVLKVFKMLNTPPGASPGDPRRADARQRLRH